MLNRKAINMKPKLQFHSAVLFVEDIERSHRFYSQVLGLETEHDFGLNKSYTCGLSVWQIKPGHIVPDKLGKRYLGASNRFELCLETEDIEQVYEQVKQSGAAFLHELHEESWGQVSIRFFDPDGHLIEIGESLGTFIRRMHSKGMSIGQIHEKSGVPAHTIEKLLG